MSTDTCPEMVRFCPAQFSQCSGRKSGNKVIFEGFGGQTFFLSMVADFLGTLLGVACKKFGKLDFSAYLQIDFVRESLQNH